MTFRSLLIFLALTASTTTAALAQVVDWRTAAISAGSWSYRATPTGSEAVFTDAGATRRFLVKCSRATRRIGLSMTSQTPAPSMMVAASDAERSLPVAFDTQAFQIVAELSTQDPLLDALAMSRGRFSVAVPGGASLVLPAWPEIARSIEDCRL